MAQLFIAVALLLFAVNGELEVLESVPVIWGGYDVMEYWNSNRAVMGKTEYPLNITSKDQNGIARIYQLQFSTQTNLNTFKQNQSNYMFSYGGFCGMFYIFIMIKMFPNEICVRLGSML